MTNQQGKLAELSLPPPSADVAGVQGPRPGRKSAERPMAFKWLPAHKAGGGGARTSSVATAVVRRGRPSVLRRGRRQKSQSRCGAPESRVVGGARSVEERSRTRQSFLNKWISPPMLTESLIRNREVSRMRNFD